MLVVAETVEAEQAKVGTPGTSALAVQEDDAQLVPLQDLTERFEELVAAIGFRRHKPFDKTKVRCYNCDKTGHFEKECPEPRHAPRTSTSSKPRTSPTKPSRCPPKSRQRPQYAVQEEEEEPEEEYAKEYESEEEEAGN